MNGTGKHFRELLESNSDYTQFHWVNPDIAKVVFDNLLITEDNLSYCARTQPLLLVRANQLLAEANNELEIVEWNRRQTQNQIEMEVRGASPEDYGIAKWTEAAVNAVVAMNKTLAEINQAVVQARQKADFVKGVVEGVRSRTNMINAVVSLKVSMNYAAYADDEEFQKKTIKQLTKAEEN